MKDAIIVDLDGTLSNCDHRLHHIRKQPKDWNAFYADVLKDTMNEWCHQIIRLFWLRGLHIIIVSGRTHESLTATTQWLFNNGIFDYVAKLYLRAPGDHRDDHIVKKEIYDEHIKGKYNVMFVLEDRKRVVDMWRAEGLTVLQCAEGDF